MKISEIRSDSALIESGDWVDDLPFDGMASVRLKVRGIGNVAYNRLQDKQLRSLPRTLSAEKRRIALEGFVTELLSQTVLIDWDGIFQEDGTTPLAYRPELAAQLLADPELRAFRDAVNYAGNVVAVRRKEDRAEAEKN